MTMDLDASLGQLLAKVDELGLDDNTYVIYLSDNGASPTFLAPRSTRRASMSL